MDPFGRGKSVKMNLIFLQDCRKKFLIKLNFTGMVYEKRTSPTDKMIYYNLHAEDCSLQIAASAK